MLAEARSRIVRYTPEEAALVALGAAAGDLVGAYEAWEAGQ